MSHKLPDAMVKLKTNEDLEAEIKSNDGMESIKLMAQELLELRKLRDSAGDV